MVIFAQRRDLSLPTMERLAASHDLSRYEEWPEEENGKKMIVIRSWCATFRP
jgi:hypothetical protein